MLTNASNSPVPGRAPKQTSLPRFIGWLIVAVALGILTGVVGTVFHLNSWWSGSFGIPWGVALALLLAGVAQWWIALRTTSIVATGVTGIAQYLSLAVMSMATRGDTFTIPWNDQTWQFVPHLVIATIAWHAGIIVVTMLNLVRLTVVLRRARRTRAMATPGLRYAESQNQ